MRERGFCDKDASGNVRDEKDTYDVPGFIKLHKMIPFLRYLPICPGKPALVTTNTMVTEKLECLDI